MQTFIYLPSSSLPLLSTKTSNTLFPAKQQHHHHHHHHQCIIKTSSTCISIKASASDPPEVDYSSMESSVFPAEACETLGGVACDVEMFPETKLKQEPNAISSPNPKLTSQTLDREYLQYDSPKTVFIAEACDDLGGEFCEPAYQSGVN